MRSKRINSRSTDPMEAARIMIAKHGRAAGRIARDRENNAERSDADSEFWGTVEAMIEKLHGQSDT